MLLVGNTCVKVAGGGLHIVQGLRLCTDCTAHRGSRGIAVLYSTGTVGSRVIAVLYRALRGIEV